MKLGAAAHEWRDRRRGLPDRGHERHEDWLEECPSQRSRQQAQASSSQIPELRDVRLAEIARAIDDASKTLPTLRRDWDDAGAEPISESTWRTAIDFLRGHAIAVLNSTGRAIPAPRILPVPDGSIDLHWKSGSNELLVNFPPAEGASAKFYGDDAGGTVIRGEIDPRRQNPGLLQWLTDL